jgi:type VI secretion system protein ImpH
LGAQAKCASRLTGAICGLFKVRAEIDELVGTRLLVETSELTRLGCGHALGKETLLGRAIFSVQDKIRIRIYTVSLAQYMRFLPTGDLCQPLADLVFSYVGEQLDWDVEPAIPTGCAEPIRIGSFGQLGWTTWMAPNWTATDEYRRDARFHPAERVRHTGKTKETGVEDGNHGRPQP